MSQKLLLLILDGWGYGVQDSRNAIHVANTPFIDKLSKTKLSSKLLTHGAYVGLPDNQMGNSEVGHLNIGSGRVLSQDLQRINNDCEEGNLVRNKKLLECINYCNNNDKSLHLIGLVSDGGIHSHQKHLYEICRIAAQKKVKNVFIHAFTDGRDTDPKSAIKHISDLEKNCYGSNIASVCGRYYAMDRDQRWERTKLAYDLLTKGVGTKSKNLIEAIKNSYEENITDEFIKPIVKVDSNNNPICNIKADDAVICFNFRTDRCRQITQVLTQVNKVDLGMKKLKLEYNTMTTYDESFNNVSVLYDKEVLNNTLGEIISKNNLTQTRIAETEKYPHVTFFFSGGREKKFDGEKRILVQSPKVKTYDLKPEMSAFEICEKTITELEKNTSNFICVNLANPDMVGHTGVFKSIIKAVETVDICTGKIVNCAQKNNYTVLVIADHGNAEMAINDDHSPNTAHTKNKVPCFLINYEANNLKDGILADIAPTILKIMNIKQPSEMTGKSLI